MTERIPPTPEDVEIVRRQLRRLIRWDLDLGVDLRPSARFLAAMERACQDYIERPRHYALMSAYVSTPDVPCHREVAAIRIPWPTVGGTFVVSEAYRCDPEAAP